MLVSVFHIFLRFQILEKMGKWFPGQCSSEKNDNRTLHATSRGKLLFTCNSRITQTYPAIQIAFKEVHFDLLFVRQTIEPNRFVPTLRVVITNLPQNAVWYNSRQRKRVLGEYSQCDKNALDAEIEGMDHMPPPKIYPGSQLRDFSGVIFGIGLG